MNSMELSGILFTGVVRAGIAATILGLIVLALERVLRKRLSPAWLFALYLPVVLRLLWPAFPESPTSIFNVPQWIRYDRAEVRAQSGLAQGTEMARTPHTVLPVLKPPGNYVDSAASSSVATPPVRTMHILALFWLGTSVILLLRLMVGWWRLQRSLPPKSMTSPKLVSALGRGRREFGVIRALTIIETPHVQSPCLFGLFKPRILLPIGLSDRLTALELRNVILHELAHLKRGDLLVNAVMVVAQTLHWFNPIVWLLLRRMRLLRELACDRMVLECQRADLAEARAYGETLLKLIQESTPRPSTPALIGILEGEHSVKARLRQLANFKRGARGNRTLGLFLLLMLGAIGLSNAQTEKIATAPGEAEQPLKESGRSDPTKLSAGIQTLEEEWARQKKEVNAARERVDELRRKLNVSSVEESGTDTEKDRQYSLQQQLGAVAQHHGYDNAMLNHLKTLNQADRAELRKTLPTALRPPDELLHRHLADLGAAEQKRILLSENFSADHPEAKSLHKLIETINRQVENRIDAILLGLEARKVVAENLASNLKNEMQITQDRYAEKQEKFAPFFEAKRDLENAQRILDTVFMRLLAEKVDSQHVPTQTPQGR